MEPKQTAVPVNSTHEAPLGKEQRIHSNFLQVSNSSQKKEKFRCWRIGITPVSGSVLRPEKQALK